MNFFTDGPPWYSVALSFGQELELVWRQRWSLMTILYLSLRTAGILYTVESPLNLGDRCRVRFLTTLSNKFTKRNSCTTLALSVTWLSFIINTILDVIIIARLHAMYQQSGKMLVFLVAIFLAITIACGVITVTLERNHFSYEEFILSGTHQCIGNNVGNDLPLITATWILGSVWEVLALCLAIWITVKRSRELRQWKIEDRFLALMKTQVLYFAAFIATTCLALSSIFSPTISTSTSVGAEVYSGTLAILQFVQMFILGPRLILSVREYNAKLVANPEADIGLQLLSRSGHTTSQVAVVYGSGRDQRVLGTPQGR
ncbi:hypothetical protein BDR03DRAFT_1015269 [Suillus americanus]|nr:hypothetical protein BDR03DRAFT_1015269 [Suillus americanus]